MPVLDPSDFFPPKWLNNGHAATFYPYFFRKPGDIPFHRKRFTTPDGDFLDVDFIFNGSEDAVFLCHGLEGSSNSKYIQGMAQYASQSGFDVIAINYRGCSGEPNKKPIAYHSGATSDLDFIIQQTTDEYDTFHLVGYSLGGNICLKYGGEKKDSVPANLRSITAISVPTQLSPGSKVLRRWQNSLYTWKFLFSLRKKMKIKHRMYPSEIPIDKWNKVRNLWDFDEYFTGPIHGFSGAEDYYEKSSSHQFINYITIPSLIINAIDDPFLHPSCFPMEIARNSDNIYLLMPEKGGHVGFYDGVHVPYWSDVKTMEFIRANL